MVDRYKQHESRLHNRMHNARDLSLNKRCLDSYTDEDLRFINRNHPERSDFQKISYVDSDKELSWNSREAEALVIDDLAYSKLKEKYQRALDFIADVEKDAAGLTFNGDRTGFGRYHNHAQATVDYTKREVSDQLVDLLSRFYERKITEEEYNGIFSNSGRFQALSEKLDEIISNGINPEANNRYKELLNA